MHLHTLNKGHGVHFNLFIKNWSYRTVYQYNDILLSEKKQFLHYNSKIHWSQSVDYKEVPLYLIPHFKRSKFNPPPYRWIRRGRLEPHCHPVSWLNILQQTSAHYLCKCTATHTDYFIPQNDQSLCLDLAVISLQIMILDLWWIDKQNAVLTDHQSLKGKYFKAVIHSTIHHSPWACNVFMISSSKGNGLSLNTSDFGWM